MDSKKILYIGLGVAVVLLLVVLGIYVLASGQSLGAGAIAITAAAAAKAMADKARADSTTKLEELENESKTRPDVRQKYEDQKNENVQDIGAMTLEEKVDLANREDR